MSSHTYHSISKYNKKIHSPCLFGKIPCRRHFGPFKLERTYVTNTKKAFWTIQSKWKWKYYIDVLHNSSLTPTEICLYCATPYTKTLSTQLESVPHRGVRDLTHGYRQIYSVTSILRYPRLDTTRRTTDRRKTADDAQPTSHRFNNLPNLGKWTLTYVTQHCNTDRYVLLGLLHIFPL